MAIQKGIPSIRRVHGKNYSFQQAQSRLDEAVKPYQQQGLNALNVDSHEVYVYLKSMSSRVCTCRQVQDVVTEMDLELHEDVTPEGIAEEQEISINWGKPLFGEPNEANFQDDTSYDEFEFDNEESPVQSSVLESSADCGICYRSGFVPGFEQYGKVRFVLTSQDLVEQEALTINRRVTPHCIDILHREGFALFAMQVPKYFKSVTYSVRNNHEILNEQLWLNQATLTLADLQNNAGRTLYFKIKAKQFTHVVVTFDLGSDPLFANVAQLSKVTDWTMFETIGNLNVILPMTIPELPVGSALYLPNKNMGLRIVDVPQLRTAKGHNLDWACNVRVMQPQEPLKMIAKGFRLF